MGKPCSRISLVYILGVADAAVDDRAAGAALERGAGHDAAPVTGDVPPVGVPDADMVGLDLVEHLDAQLQLAAHGRVVAGADGEGEPRQHHLVAQRHNARRQRLQRHAQLAHHIVDRAGVEFLETLADLRFGDGQFNLLDRVAFRLQTVDVHLVTHVCSLNLIELSFIPE